MRIGAHFMVIHRAFSSFPRAHLIFPYKLAEHHRRPLPPRCTYRGKARNSDCICNYKMEEFFIKKITFYRTPIDMQKCNFLSPSLSLSARVWDVGGHFFSLQIIIIATLCNANDAPNTNGKYVFHRKIQVFKLLCLVGRFGLVKQNMTRKNAKTKWKWK